MSGIANASPASAKRMVLVSLAVAGGLASVHSFGTEDLPPLRIFLGAVVAGVLLSLLADFGGASLAAGLAAVILLTSLVVLGGDAWQRIGKVVTP